MSSDQKTNRLAAWMAGNLKAHGPKATQIELAQRSLRADGQEAYAPVFTWDANAGDARELADAITQAAQVDADDTGGACRYSVTVRAADGAVLARHDLRYTGKLITGDVGPEEPANAAGLVGQAMRHLEATQRMMLQSLATVSDQTERHLARQAAQIDRMSEREERVMSLFEALSSQKMERDLAWTREMRGLELKDKALAKLEPLIPVILGRISSRGGQQMSAPSAAPDPSIAMLDALLLSISEEQLPRLGAALNEQQKVALLELYRTAQERAQTPETPKTAAPEMT